MIDHWHRYHCEEYETYPLLKEAIECSYNNNHLPIFSKDKRGGRGKGSKTFLVMGYKTFWNMYIHTAPEHRTFYETILENFPCHLYIDLEYDKKNNIYANINNIHKTLKEYIRKYFYERYQIRVEKIKFHVLDSSTDQKISRHYVIKLEENNGNYFCFKNNYHCGAFMRNFILFLEKNRDISNTFQVYNKDGITKNYCIDMAVYTKNRQFRIYGSTKLDQQRYLIYDEQSSSSSLSLSSENIDENYNNIHLLKECHFYETLIQYTSI